MAHVEAVSTGQRYVKTYHLTRERTLWRVADVKVMGATLPHALLVNCHDPRDLRTVSCAELTAGGAYDLLKESAETRGPAATLNPGLNLHVEQTDRLALYSARAGRLLGRTTRALRRLLGVQGRALPMGGLLAAAKQSRRAG